MRVALWSAGSLLLAALVVAETHRCSAGEPEARGKTAAPEKATTKSSWLPFTKRTRPEKDGPGKAGPMASLPKGRADKAETEMSVARLAERRGQTAQAEKLFSALAQKYPQLVTPHHRLGVIAARQGRLPEAEQHLQTALRLDPRNVDILSDVGYLYHLENRFADAERMYRQGLAINPEHQALCNNLGMLLVDQGRTADALTVFKQVNPEADAHMNLGFMLAQRGELDQAQEHFSRALTLNNKLRPAASALIQLAEREQNTAVRTAGPESVTNASPAAAPAAPLAEIKRLPIGRRLPAPETASPTEPEATLVRVAPTAAPAAARVSRPASVAAEPRTDALAAGAAAPLSRRTVARSRVVDDGDGTGVARASFTSAPLPSGVHWPVAPVPVNLNPHAATKPLAPTTVPAVAPASPEMPPSSTKRVRISD